MYRNTIAAYGGKKWRSGDRSFRRLVFKEEGEKRGSWRRACGINSEVLLLLKEGETCDG